MCRTSPTDSNATVIEPIARPLPGWRGFRTSLDRHTVTNAMVSWLFAAGIVYGLLFVAFGILAPAVVGLASTLPASFIGVLGGLALLRALQSWMATAFSGDLSLGALTAFLVTLSGVSIFHIGAAFWGLIFGVGISWLLEQAKLQKAQTRSSRG